MQIDTQNVDHLGLVAGMCEEIGLVGLIDQAVGNQAKNKHLTYGQAVKCMILNGLGFVSRTLYMYSEYFEDKPIDHLLGTPVIPEQIDDNVLGRALDKLFELGVTELFTKIALHTIKVLGIQVKSLHLDATSFHVDGNYESLLEQGEACIRLVQGYSRDHRPDLNQAVLQLITSNEGNIPLYMQAADGNSSDKTAFTQIVGEHLKSFRQAVENRYIVGDSALYTPATLQVFKEEQSLFVTRVPMQIKEAKELIFEVTYDKTVEITEGYRAFESTSCYAGVEQRWVVIFSQAAYQRECRTLAKHYLKGSEKESKAFFKFIKQEFSCPNDAKRQLDKLVKKLKYIQIIEPQVIATQKHTTSGRPKAGQAPSILSYRLEGTVACSLLNKAELERSKGFFILATNDMDVNTFPAQELLKTYKAQQSVERGFRFLKSPDFLVSSFFLKKPERIEALLMVMTLCLLVYSALEYKIREKLRENGENFLNQLKKPTQKPTTRWVFFCFLGLHMVFIDHKKLQITNLKERHRIILRCLGPPYQKFYYSEMW
ncbi:Transposase, IS4 family protein [Neochlamydia sp. EPS4]|uniref:IS1634 family transposase n=2 Tax=unclassified Neochlamydia TaxID=2643326 RepID=UPI000583B260|nr:IS1634 family transposase [Neochlamydia sp. EPS4]KIC73272.1 Transposase, IS4 family protein [Neochlamydia sp. EPS4]